MELQEFKNIVGEIGQNLSDQGKVTTLLTKLVDDYTTESTTKSTLLADQATHAKVVQDLQKTNMDLFLKVANPTPDTVLNTTDPLTYEGLFDEKGGLK